ncbi:MAG: hypothetical protein II935_03755 [Bacteroidales bacterium]|nr:hypothetical protein [Bacteroidales bacterium]
MSKYKQTIIPSVKTPEAWKKLKGYELRNLIFDTIKKKYAGQSVINKDFGIPITISVSSGRKTAFGEAIYSKKAAAVLILPDIIANAKYNNWGNPKEEEGANIKGYMNFKCKVIIDGKTEHIRLAVQFQKGGKYYYNIEINKIPTPERSKA